MVYVLDLAKNLEKQLQENATLAGIEEYNLHGKIRWLGLRLTKSDSGEIYRVIGDRQRIFVQPALFEAFGLTILESMISGLPTFATQFGGHSWSSITPVNSHESLVLC